MSLSKSHFADKKHLTTRSYKTADKLNIRIRTHEQYTHPKIDFTVWVLDRIAWRGDEVVVDIGCGAGAYVAPVRQRCGRYIAGDLSFGMVHGLSHPGLDRINLDVQALPLADCTADVVLANHMLYHVPDKDAALAEIARVLRPGGYLIAATNSAHSMAELVELRRLAMERLGAPLPPDWRRNFVDGSFSLEDGRSTLKNHFSQISRHDLPSALVFPSPEPILDYLDSSRDWYERFLPDGTTGDDLLEAFRDVFDEHFAHNDEFRVNKLSGVFVCR